MLEERGLTTLLGAQEVAEIVGGFRERFSAYTEDSLWPMFKFPLTANERTRLTNKVKVSLMRFGSALDPVSTNVQYGGPADYLKHKTRHEVFSVIENLMVETAFIRRPLCPGVSGAYRTRCGFTLAVKSFRYREGDRPKERFQAMKYFHVGHLLEDVVAREVKTS